MSLLFIIQLKSLVLPMAEENSNLCFAFAQQFKQDIHDSIISFFCVLVHLLPFYFFALKSDFFYYSRKPLEHLFIMLRPDKYTTIEIGIVLTCRISTPQSLMFTN